MKSDRVTIFDIVRNYALDRFEKSLTLNAVMINNAFEKHAYVVFLHGLCMIHILVTRQSHKIDAVNHTYT